VRKKLNAMALEFADKNVLLVDGRSHHPGSHTV
jgi:glutamine phosphoribosylpyrophosphate amidotransferase